MSVIFCSAGVPPVATTFNMPSAIRVAVRELPDDFLSRLIVVFQRAGGVRFARADLPIQLLATSATPPRTFLVAIGIIANEAHFPRVMGHETPLCRVEGPATKAAEAGSGGGARSTRSRSRGDALTDIERARAESSSLADFKAALKEREEAFDRDAVTYFFFTDQIDYDGAGCQGSSDGGAKAVATAGPTVTRVTREHPSS